MQLRFTDVTLQYGRTQVLTDISSCVRPGVTALLGVNGSGKTTLINALVGLKKPTNGEILLDDVSVTTGRYDARCFSYVPQDMRFPSGLSCRKAIEYSLWLRGFDSQEAQSRAADALDKVGLGDRADRPVKSLSGGMKRRLALSTAFGGEPGIIILDEPSTGLDPQQRHDVVRLLRNVEGTTLISSHVLEDIYELADAVIVLHNKSIVFDGSLDEYLAHSTEAHGPQRMWPAFQAIIGHQ